MNIPSINCPAVALYINKYVEWNTNLNKWYSEDNTNKSMSKVNDIKDIILLRFCNKQEDFLLYVEEDKNAKKWLKQIQVCLSQ